MEYVENSVLIKKKKKNIFFLIADRNTYFIIFVLWILNFVDQQIYDKIYPKYLPTSLNFMRL